MFSSLCLMLILLMSVDGTSTSNNRPNLHTSQNEMFIEELSDPGTIHRSKRFTSGAQPNCSGLVEQSICDPACTTAGICADEGMWVPVAYCGVIPNTICINGECVLGTKEDCHSSRNATDPYHGWRPNGRSWTPTQTTTTKLPIFSGAQPNCSGFTGTYVCDETHTAYGVCTIHGSWVPVANCAAIPNRTCHRGLCVPGSAADWAAYSDHETSSVDNTTEINATNEAVPANIFPIKPTSLPRNCTGLIGQYVCDEKCATNGVCATENSWIPVEVCNAYPNTICLNGQCVLGGEEECNSPYDAKSAVNASETVGNGVTGLNDTRPDCKGHLMEYLCASECKSSGVCISELEWVVAQNCATVPNMVCLEGICVPGTKADCPGNHMQ